MNIVVNTKFNVGDRVYVVNFYHDFYVTDRPYIIKDFLVKINKHKTFISYEVEQNNSTEMIPEQWIFSNYEDGVAWCDNMNRDF